MTKVNEAIHDTESATGADIYVRSFDTAPMGSLDEWWRTTYKQCSNWLATDTVTPKPNVIVLVFSMDRSSGIFYGSGWHLLDGRIDQIRSADMNANFKSGDFTKGVTSALNDIRLAKAAPPSAAAVSSSNNSSVGRGLLVAFIVVAVFALMLLALWFGAKSWLARQRGKAELAEARQALQEAKDVADRNMADLSPRELKASYLLAANDLPKKARVSFDSSHEEIERDIQELQNRHGALQLNFNPDSTSAEVCRRETEKWQEGTTQVRQVRARASKLDSIVAGRVEILSPKNLLRQAVKLDSELTTSTRQLDNLSKSYDVQDTCERARKLSSQVGEIKSQLENANIDVLAVERDLDTARQQVKDLEAYVADLSRTAGRISNAQKELKEVSERAERRLDLADATQDERDALKSLEPESARVLQKLCTERQLSVAETMLDEIVNRVTSTPDSAEKRKAEAKRKRRDEEEAERRRRRNARRRSSYRSSSSPNSSFYGGFAGGYLGSSGSSSSSYDFGGGSSGSWGGGSDFGGGSSGSWEVRLSF